MVTNPPAMQETQVQSLGWGDPLEKEGQLTLIFCLENFIDRAACWDRVQGAAKSQDATE